jgi:hypothetical protein
LPSIAKHSEVWKTDAYKRLSEQAKLANPEGKYPGPVESWVNGPSNSYGANAHLTMDVHVSNLEMAKDVFRELGYQDKHMRVTPKLVEQGLGRERQQVDRGLVSVRVPWAKPAKSLKHADHDQSDHGNRDGASHQPTDKEREAVGKAWDHILLSSKTPPVAIEKINRMLGKDGKPDVAPVSSPIYRGFPSQQAFQEFLDGKQEFRDRKFALDGRELLHTWGVGVYLSPHEDVARNYAIQLQESGDHQPGVVATLGLSPDAKMITEEMWSSAPVDGLDYEKAEYDGSISSAYSAYWAAQGYDGAYLGSEIVIWNSRAVVVDPSSIKTIKFVKHADHDQSEHGSWADDSGAEKEGRERRDPWEGSLITREKAYEVVNYYTGRGYNDINRHLRDTDAGVNDADIEEKIDAMDAAFFRAPMSSEDRTVYRGVSPNIGRELLAGETFKDKGYTSTTTDMSVTEDFTSYSDGSKYVMEITIPSGTQFIEVEESSEKEIILNKGSRFSIDEVREEGDYKIIVATLLTGYQGKSKSLKHLDGEHDQGDHGSWATGITGGKKLPAPEFAAKVVAKAAESRGGKSGVQQLDLSNTSSFAEIKSASDKITEAIDKEMGKWPSMYAEPRVEPTEQQKFLKQFSDGADLMRNTLHSANEGAIGRNKDFQFFVATGVDGTTPVGTLVYRNFTRENVGNNPYLTGHEDKWMELTNIGTNGLEPGVGTRLVTQVLGAAAESGRGVWLNDPYDEAARFYKELGFEMKYKQGDWIGYMEPETVQEWWKSYEAAGGK